jgi:mannose-1-phosphate guanylyltransferase
MIGTPKLLDALPAGVPSDIGFDVLPRLKNQMMAFPVKDYLIDEGTLENYYKAQATWPGYRRLESRGV